MSNTQNLEATDIAPATGAEVRSNPAAPARTAGASLTARIVILGGGTAGLAAAAALAGRLGRDADILLIEPSAEHYYQPGFTLVGGGVRPLAWTRREQAALIPHGTTWIRERAESIDAAASRIVLADGRIVAYEYLVACPGLALQWGRVPGLKEAMGDGRVCSIYAPETAADTWARIRALDGGRALFTQPPMPIKCPGAPQKIVYMAADHWRRQAVLDRTEVCFRTATPSLFSVAEYVPTLERVAARHGVDVGYGARLVEVDGAAARAVFERAGDDGRPQRWSERYDLLHAVPPQGPRAVVRDSALADADGWLDVDHETLRHRCFPNVFGIGDATSVPTSKTAAAVRAQLPVVVANLEAAMHGGEPPLRYDGYASCPLITAYGRVVLAEFVYGRKPAPSFPWDSTKERRAAWWLKTRFIPWMYWNRLLTGRDVPGTAISRQLSVRA